MWSGGELLKMECRLTEVQHREEIIENARTVSLNIIDAVVRLNMLKK